MCKVLVKKFLGVLRTLILFTFQKLGYRVSAEVLLCSKAKTTYIYPLVFVKYNKWYHKIATERMINYFKSPQFILIILGVVILGAIYGEILQAPNDHLFVSSNDGLKNYYTYAHHIKNSAGYTDFEGMNYPFGESYLYTDCHPLLTSIFKFLSNYFPFFSTHAVGILNFLMLGAIFLCFLVVYELLLAFKMNKWFAVFFSLSIVMLAPQVFRLDGHQALSYSMVVPFSWLLLMKYLRNNDKKRLILLFVNIVFWLFIHVYLGVVIVLFLGAYTVLEVITSADKKACFKKNSLLFLSLLAPIVLFLVYASFIDAHENRIENPAGFFLYNAQLDDLLVPYNVPLRPLLDWLTNGSIKLQWEAKGYLGIFNSLLFIFSTLFLITAIFVKRCRKQLSELFPDPTLTRFVIAGFLVLLFAFGLPFKLYPPMLDLISKLKQFRATGRFIWPMYFSFAVFGALTAERLMKKYYNSRKFLQLSLLVTALSTTFFEGIYIHEVVVKQISQEANLFKTEHLNPDLHAAMEAIEDNKYKAIISIPFFHLGSETFTIKLESEAVKNTLLISYHKNMPTFCNNASRTSIDESKKIIQLISPNYYSNEIKDDLSPDDEYLIVKSRGAISEYENIILQKAQTLGRFGDLELLRISYKTLFSDDTPKVWSKFKLQKNELSPENGFLINKANTFLYYNDFEDSTSMHPFRGRGGYEVSKAGAHCLVSFEPGTFKSGDVYDMSMWMYNAEQDALNLWFRFRMEEYDAAGNMVNEMTVFPEFSEVLNGYWTLAEGTFKIHDAQNIVRIMLYGKEDNKARFFGDDLLIKEHEIDIYKVKDSSFFYNNHRLKQPAL